MTGKRQNHSACLRPNGTGLLTGGMKTPNHVIPLDTAEVFDLNGTNDAPGVGVSDASVVEGDSGTNFLNYTVWLTTSSAFAVTVDYATAILNDDGFAGRVHHFDFAPIGATRIQTVGFPVTITAKVVFGNTVTNFAGPLKLLTYVSGNPHRSGRSREWVPEHQFHPVGYRELAWFQGSALRNGSRRGRKQWFGRESPGIQPGFNWVRIAARTRPASSACARVESSSSSQHGPISS